MKVRTYLQILAVLCLGIASQASAQTPPQQAAAPAQNKQQHGSAQTLFAEGFELLKVSNPAEAAKRFERGLKLDPRNAMAWFYLGEARLRNGANAAALAAYKKSIDMDASSQVADAARARIGELGHSAGAAEGNAAASKSQGKPAGAVPKDPRSIVLDSGLTLADWLQYAVEQLKKGEVDRVLQDGAEHQRRFGRIEVLTTVLDRAVADKLASVQVDDATNAAKSIPMLEFLARDFPGSMATVKLMRARAVTELANARTLLDAGRFEEAEQAYRVVLTKIPVGDPLRIELVPEIEAARKREKLLVAGSVFRDCADCPELVVIPSGSFQMGSTTGDAAEKPVHSVNVKSFALGKYEVTRGQYVAFVASSGHSAGNSCWVFTGSQWADTPDRTWRNPGFAQTDNDPVVCVNWDDAQAYVRWLSQKTGRTYRLPSEAEWEYACRAGVNQTYCGSDDVDSVAVYGSKSGDKTQPAGGKQANAWGLQDMSGNVSEWTQDCGNGTYIGAPADGSAWTAGNCGERVLRGGSWNSHATLTRAALRNWNDATNRSSNYGFRLARIAP